MKIPLSIEKATAETVATGNIILHLIFHFHEEISICRFHELSHTFATRCVEKNIDLKTISEILGHSSVKITLDRYVHSRKNRLSKTWSGIVKSQRKQGLARKFS